MQAIDRIYENINNGYRYGYYVCNVRYPYFHTYIGVSDDRKWIRWNHYGSSANKNTKQALQWIIETIFQTTPEKFEKENLIKYRGA